MKKYAFFAILMTLTAFAANAQSDDIYYDANRDNRTSTPQRNNAPTHNSNATYNDQPQQRGSSAGYADNGDDSQYYEYDDSYDEIGRAHV